VEDHETKALAAGGSQPTCTLNLKKIKAEMLSFANERDKRNAVKTTRTQVESRS